MMNVGMTKVMINTVYNTPVNQLIFCPQWDLICGEKYKVAMVQSIWMFGVMSGALVLGGLADMIGRLKTLMLALLCSIGFEGFSAFAPTYTIMVVFR